MFLNGRPVPGLKRCFPSVNPEPLTDFHLQFPVASLLTERQSNGGLSPGCHRLCSLAHFIFVCPLVSNTWVLTFFLRMLFRYDKIADSSLESRMKHLHGVPNRNAIACPVLNAFEFCHFFIHSVYLRSFSWATTSNFLQPTADCALSPHKKEGRL